MEIYLPDGIKIPFKLSFVCLLLSVTDAAVPRSARANAAFQIPVPWSCVQADICRFHAPIADLQISPRVQTHQPYKHCFSVSSFSPFGSGHPEQGGAFSSDPTRASSAEVSVNAPRDYSRCSAGFPALLLRCHPACSSRGAASVSEQPDAWLLRAVLRQCCCLQWPLFTHPAVALPCHPQA